MKSPLQFRAFGWLFVLAADASGLAGKNPEACASLPVYQVIPAVTSAELTPSSGKPAAVAMTAWTQSHGDMGAPRYSALTQINRGDAYVAFALPSP